MAATLPYVAVQYRRRGAVGAGHLFLVAAAGLYLVGLAFSVILPLRPVTPDFCTLYQADAHVSPLYLIDEFRGERALGGWGAILGNTDFQDLVLNVFLFVPLGFFARHLMRKGFGATVAIGLGVSLLIEMTQLTGNWGLYPCAYRYFSTTDLITNTTGAAIGAACAPLLRLVPGQLTLKDPGLRQPVTAARRFLAAACNAAAVLTLGLFLLAMAGLLLEVTRGQLFESESARAEFLRAATLVWLPGLTLMLAVPLIWQGRTPGEWAVLLRHTGRAGEDPDRGAVIRRFLIGPAPILLAAGFGVAGTGYAWLVVLAIGTIHVLAITRRKPAETAPIARGSRLEDSR